MLSSYMSRMRCGQRGGFEVRAQSMVCEVQFGQQVFSGDSVSGAELCAGCVLPGRTVRERDCKDPKNSYEQKL